MKQFIYLHLANTLAAQIDNKIWLVNEKLPSIRALATHYGVSKISVQKALHTLEANKRIFVKPKSGYYVLPEQENKLTKQALKKINKPALVDVPEMFYEIMARCAAFDIAPRSISGAQSSNHLLLLNRHISRALRQQTQNNALYYSEPAGDEALRQQIKAHYRKRNLNVSAQDICITSGCQNSLYLALTVTCQPGDIVAIESPAFYGVLQLLQQLKLQVIEIPCSFTTGLTAEALKNAADKWPIKACVLTANFATPTGALIPAQEKKRIVEIAHQKNISLIEDDIYGDLGFHSNVEPLKSAELDNNVILCGSFSKSLSRDLRIGWLIAKKQHKKVVHMKLITQLSTSQAMQQGLTSFLAEGHFERHIYHYRSTLLKQRDQLLKAINEHWQLPIKYTVPDGGLAVWIELPKQIDTFMLYNLVIHEGIVLTPGRLFSSSDNFANYLRLSFAHPTTGHRLAALKRLGEVCKTTWQKSHQSG